MMNMLTTECSNPARRTPGSASTPHDAADGGGGTHRHHHPEADHPVAQDRLDEDGQHAGGAEMGVSDRLGLGDLDDARGDAGGFHLARVRQRDHQQAA
jgi:hypothetical protein